MSKISEVEMCNLALSHVGLGELIQSLDDDTTPARQCKLLFTPTAIDLLIRYNWSFAERKQYLALLDGVSPVDYTYAYTYPSDCLRFREIYNSLSLKSPPIKYAIQLSADNKSRYIETNQATAIGVYTVDVSDKASSWSEFFTMAFIWGMAMKLVIPLTRNSKMIQAVSGLAEVNIAQMVGLDLNEDYESFEEYNGFTAVRK